MFEHFPTNFAMKIANRAKLVQASSMEDAKQLEKEMLSPKSEYDAKSIKNFYIELNILQEFQELSVSNKFEDCCIAYHDVNLNEEQKTALLLIHKTTPTYIIGHLTNNLLMRVKDSKDQELIQLTSAIISILKDEKLGTLSKEQFEQAARRFVVRPMNGK